MPLAGVMLPTETPCAVTITSQRGVGPVPPTSEHLAVESVERLVTQTSQSLATATLVKSHEAPVMRLAATVKPLQVMVGWPDS